MLLSDLDYQLPEELIAQHPLEERGRSRMLVMDRNSGCYTLKSFQNFPNYLNAGDCLVLNDSKVIPARLYGYKNSGARIEALLIEEERAGVWTALLRPSRRVKINDRLSIDRENSIYFNILQRRSEKTFCIEFSLPDSSDILRRFGQMPLPPYIRRDANVSDRERYQTVYARESGSIAAPSAGLHFTPAILEKLAIKGIRIAHITLHIGYATFQPIAVKELKDHHLHSEIFSLSPEDAEKINRSKREGKRIVATGTSTVRVLESCVDAEVNVEAREGRSDLFLYPPYRPRIVDTLLTNFHLPKSSLLALVCTFAEREKVLEAYRFAIRQRLRFYSYGDCMFLNS